MTDLDGLFRKLENKATCIRSHVCAFCGDEITGFKDELSRKEYLISGTCQKCQDQVFEEDEE